MAVTVEKELSPLAFHLCAVVVGVIAGVGALFFRYLIGLVHNLFFLGKLSPLYDASVHTPPSPWGAAVILVPVAGGLGVAFLVQHFAPETKGHGVPEVMDAIYYKTGKIRPVVALVKSLTSALSIGSGASIGREGPIVQIGSAFGSTLAQGLKVAPWQQITLIAAGAGGGIAATFNTPVGGILFAMELLLHEVSVKTIVPVTIATASAAYLGQLFFGPNPAFAIPAFQHPYFVLTSPEILLAYLGLGILTGLASAAYIRSIYAAEDFFDRMVPKSYYLRHSIGMLLAGTIFYALFRATGHYHVEGVGYATVQDILTSSLDQGGLLLLLFFLKLLATSLALGSGASGGVFSPALFLGASLAASYGVLLRGIFPGLEISPAAFAVAGMAGVVGGATGATATAIVMILEMTYDYTVVIPVTMTVALSYGIRNYLLTDSIYTLKLTRRGHYMPRALLSSVHQLRRARDLMDTRFTVVPPALPLPALAELLRDEAIRWYVVEGETVRGVLSRDTAAAAVSGGGDSPATVGDLAIPPHCSVDPDATVVDVMAAMRRAGAAVAAVVDDPDGPSAAAVRGIIGNDSIVGALSQSFAIFSGDRYRVRRKSVRK